MAVKWHKTEYRGVRFRECPGRPSYRGQPDRYYAIYYYRHGKRIDEGLGFANPAQRGKLKDGEHGWTARKAYMRLLEIKQAISDGEGPQSMGERRAGKKAEAEAKRARNLTFAEFFQDHYFPHARTSKKPGSYAREAALFKQWLAPAFGPKAMHAIGATDLQGLKRHMKTHRACPVKKPEALKGEDTGTEYVGKWKVERVAKGKPGCSPRTINYALALVRQVFNHARSSKLYKGPSPLVDVKLEKFDNRRVRFLTPEEAAGLLEIVRGISSNVADYAMLSLRCGLRAGEIFGLTWADVDLGRGTLTLRDTKSKATRTAYLDEDTRAIFEGRKRGTPSALVFPTHQGTKRQQVPKSFMKAVDLAKLNDGIEDPRQRVYFHTLRHTFASWLVEAGTPIFVVKEALGHKTTAMAERYAHLGQNTIREAVSKLPPMTAPSNVVSLDERRKAKA